MIAGNRFKGCYRLIWKYVDEHDIQNAILNNTEIKNRLVQLLSDMMASLKGKLTRMQISLRSICIGYLQRSASMITNMDLD